MELRQLKYFLTIAECGSVSGAAEKLHISQSPLSQQLKQLETELGVILFFRTTRQLQITEAGLALKYRAEQLLQLSDIALDELQNFQYGYRGTLRISSISGGAESFLPDILHLYHQTYPGVQLHIKFHSIQTIIDSLRVGNTDFGIITPGFDTDEFASIVLTDEPLYVAGTKDYFGNRQHGKIRLAELQDKPLIVPKRYVETLQNTCMLHGFLPKIVCIAEGLMPQLPFIRAGLGVGFITGFEARSEGAENICLFEAEELDISSGLVLVWPKTGRLSLAAQNFIKEVRKKTDL